MEQTAELYIVSRIRKLERENDNLVKTIQSNEQQYQETLGNFKSETQLWIRAFGIVEKTLDVKVEKVDLYNTTIYKIWLGCEKSYGISEQDYILLKRIGVKDL